MKNVAYTLRHLALVLALFAVPAMASMLIDFEAPAYTGGIRLPPQNGWTTNYDAAWYVSKTTTLSGAQAAHVDWQSYAYESIAGQAFSDGTVVSALLKVSNVSGYGYASSCSFELDNAAGKPVSYVHLSDAGVIWYLNATGDGYVSTGHTYTKEDKIGVAMTCDFANSQWQLSIQNYTTPANSFVLNGLSFSSATTAATAAGKFTLGGQFTYFDDLAVTGPVPEPASLALLGLGVVALLRRRR